MKKPLKILIAVVGLVVLIVASVLIAFIWPKSINFNDYAPSVWSTCDGDIQYGSEEYKEIEMWFVNNQEGWQTFAATVAPTYTISGEEIYVYVWPNSVIINYNDIENGWSQVSKDGRFPIRGECQ